MSTDDSLAALRHRPRRSALSVPAINRRALDKTPTLDCDVVIFDLEDSVAPAMKGEARDNLRGVLGEGRPEGVETVIRINAAGSGFQEDDIALAAQCRPDAVLLPKVNGPADLAAARAALARAGAENIPLWAMIETPQAIVDIAAITGGDARPDCLVVGLNDLRKDTGVADLPGRPWLVSWLMQVVLAARARKLDVIDSVFNDFRNADAFEAECAQGRDMGFDGKMLIHPAQIGAANRLFAPGENALREAQAIVSAFAEPDNAHANVINMDGRMVERLHMEQAQRLLDKQAAIAARKEKA